MWRSPRLADAALITSHSLRRFRDRYGAIEASEDSPHFQRFALTRPKKPVGAFLTLAGKADAGGLKAAHGPRCGSSGGYWEFARSFAKRIQIDVAKLREHDRILKFAD